MTRTHIPEAVLTAAHDRARARAERDWTLADRLRGEIEAAGWTIVDRGTDFALAPAAPPDLDEGARVRYGSSRNVPARFEEPAVGLATVVLIATDWPADLDRAMAGLRAHAPAGTSVVIVADGPSDAQADGPRGARDGRRDRGAPDRRSSGRRSALDRAPPSTSASGGPGRRSSSCSTRAWSRPATS